MSRAGDSDDVGIRLADHDPFDGARINLVLPSEQDENLAPRLVGVPQVLVELLADVAHLNVSEPSWFAFRRHALDSVFDRLNLGGTLRSQVADLTDDVGTTDTHTTGELHLR